MTTMMLQLCLALFAIVSLPCPSWAEDELTIDLYLPKYAVNTDDPSNNLKYALPTDPLTLLHKIVDPKTHQAIHIFFVCNTNSEGGNGSYKNPFSTLKAAEEASKPHDIIYVFRGDGTSKGMDRGICLKDHQHLLGSNHPYTFETPFGTLLLPRMTQNAPVITHTSGNAVELASHNEVNGLAIYNAQGWGIHGKGIQEAQIQHMDIRVNGDNGAVGLEDVLGRFDVVENSIDGTQQKHVNGIDIRNHGSAMANFTIRKNHITHFDAGVLLLTFDKAVALTNIAQNAIGACLDKEIETNAYDTSELHSFVMDNILTQLN